MSNSVQPEVFFLRGFMRSGTNWLGRILNHHPDINCVGEFHLQGFQKAFNECCNLNSCLNKDQTIKIIRNNYYDFVRQNIIDICGTNYKLVGDRTPAPLAKLVIPNSKYIIISRDGRDVLVSWFFHAIKKNLPYLKNFSGMKKKSLDFQKNKNFFENNKELLLNNEKFFRHGAKLWNNRILSDKKICNAIEQGEIEGSEYYWIQYEKLHSNIDVNRNDIYVFLGLDPSKASKINNETQPGFSNEESKSSQQRGVVGRWKDYFSPQNHIWFDEEASEAMEILGITSTKV